MSREEVKAFLQTLGIENPEKEQIDAYLNKFNEETKGLKEQSKSAEDKAKTIAELQAQLDAINNANLTEIEKAQKETEKANQQIADLQAQIKKAEIQRELAKLNIQGEQADNFFKADGSLDFSVLGQILTDRVTMAKSEKEKELLKGTPNPTGSDKGNNDEKSDVDKMAESVGKEIASANATSNDVLANYI